MGRLAFISGVEGQELSDAERDYFKQAQPLGLILFARNLDNADQIKRLIADVRECVGQEQFWVLIDQEGGRVQRLLPPLFPRLPAARRYAQLYQDNPSKALHAAQIIGQLMGKRLLDLGINVNCTPVLDAAQPDAHEIISDRSFGTDIEQIVSLGRRHAQGHMQSGVLPVIKHIPGHGRAKADSHVKLPIIDTPLAELKNTDFEPFRRLNEMPLAMTAHVIYKDFDPTQPVSTSSKAITQLIREHIGFDGFLMCDDVSMQALEGTIGQRTHAVMRAGCDGALHCNGVMEEMEQVANASPTLEGQALSRFETSFEMIAKQVTMDETQALDYLDENWCRSN